MAAEQQLEAALRKCSQTKKELERLLRAGGDPNEFGALLEHVQEITESLATKTRGTPSGTPEQELDGELAKILRTCTSAAEARKALNKEF